MTQDTRNEEPVLNEKEIKLIRLIRGMDFGEMNIFVSDSVPTEVEEIRRNLKI